jgi:hypothetical protein
MVNKRLPSRALGCKPTAEDDDTQASTSHDSTNEFDLKSFVRWKQVRSLQQKMTELTAFSGERTLVMISFQPDRSSGEAMEARTLGSFTAADWSVLQQVSPAYR